MNKFKIIVMLLSVFCYAHSQQYHKFIENNKKWHVYYSCDKGPCSIVGRYMTYYFEGDTVINLGKYRILKCNFDESNGINFPIENGIIYNAGFYREDTISKRVYAYYFGNKELDITEREILLYDFNLKIGDSITSISKCSSSTATTQLYLDKIDTINSISGEQIRKYTFNDNSIYIEGLGSINSNIVITDTLVSCNLYSPDFECVKINNQSFYGSDCDKFTSLHNIDLEEFDVFPTLVTDRLSIVNHNSSPANFNIYSITGVLLLSKKIHSNNEELSLTNYTKGIYYYIISDQNRIIKTGKLIRI